MTTSEQDTSSSARSRYPHWESVLFWCLLLGGCAVFLLMNFYTPIKEDDIFHSYIGGGTGRPTNNLLDVLRSWVAYYQYDARLANIISFTFNGILGKTVFNVVNTLVFGLMAYWLSRIATGRNSALVLVMLFTYMVTAMPVPGETLLWPTAAFNYLWALTASLLFIAYLKFHTNPRPGWLKGIVLFLVSLFIGGINEGTTFGVFGGLVLYYLVNRDKVDRTVIIAMAGYLAGVLVLITCPGAWGRASLEVSHDAGIISLLVDRLKILWNSSCHYVTPLAALAIILFTHFGFGFKNTFSNFSTCSFVALLGFVFVVGKDQQRLFFSLTMFGLLIVVAVADALLRNKQWLRIAVMAVGLLLCAIHYPLNIATMKRYQAFFHFIDKEIRLSDDRQVVLTTGQFNDYSRFIKYFNFDSWNFFIREETLCYYYDKDNIQFVPDSVYARFHSGRLLDGAEPMPFVAPDCPDVEEILAIHNQDYWVVKMRQDTISHSYQFAQAYRADGTPTSPPIVGYFPLLFQGHEYLVFPPVDSTVTRLEFSPYALDGETITLQRTDATAEP